MKRPTHFPNSSRAFLSVASALIFFMSQTATSGESFAACLWQALHLNHQRLVANGFKVERTAQDYLNLFGPEFREAIESLSPDSHWLDAGAGEARAQLELTQGIWHQGRFLRIRSHHLTAFSLAKPETLKNGEIDTSALSERDFHYLEGKYIEDQDTAEIRTVDLITDLKGPFSYTAQIDIVLRKYLRLLKVGGTALIYFEPTSIWIDGKSASLLEYMSKIPGVEVKIDPSHPNVLILKKLGWTQDSDVPSLRLKDFIASAPRGGAFDVPIRLYTSKPPHSFFKW